MNKVYIDDLTNGDLIIPLENLGWTFTSSAYGPKKNRVYTSGKQWSNSSSPGIYLRKIRLKEIMDGLKTWHEVMIEGSVYYMEGYESSRILKV